MATILIIDDTPTNLAVMVGHLEAQGYRVLVAQDGEEGVQRAELTRPDLILLDVMMPGMSGFEVCRRLKSRSITREIPVIFMTSLTATRDKVTGFEAGAVDYVTKPLQAEEVIARIDTHLKLRAAQTQLEAQNAMLAMYREDLEGQVAERTAELHEANRRLHAEIAERERAEDELRPPLRAIADCAQRVIELGRDRIQNEERHCLERILRDTSRMSARIEDLLGHPRAPRTAAPAERVALEPLIRQATESLAARIAAARASIEVRSPLPVAVGDPSLIARTVANLLESALARHRPQAAPRIRVSGALTEGEVLLEIADDGVDIASVRLAAAPADSSL